MRRLAILLLLGACGGHAAPTPAPAPASPDPALVARLDAIAQAAMADEPSPGLSVAISWHGAVVARGYGKADVEHDAAVTADTVFRIGSITKQLAAAAVLRHAAAGDLAIDDRLTKYLPDYPVHGRAITLRHLLTHTSGIADYERAPWLQAHMDEARPVSELVDSFAAEPFTFEPGAAWAYSNAGYFLLGQILEQIASRPLADELEAMLADAGVAGVRYCPDQQDYPEAAHGYEVTDAGLAPARTILMRYATAAGAMCATATGLVAWTLALADGKVVDAAGWREMTTPVQLADGSRYDYGMGLFLGSLGEHRALFHSGGINGFAAQLAYYPDDELVIATLTNSESGLADQVAEAIARDLLEVPAPVEEDLPVDDAEAQAVVGRYTITAIGVTVAIEADAGVLYAHPEGEADRAPLRRQADGRYLVTGAEASITFVRDGDRVTGLELVQAGMTFRGDRLP